MRNEYLTKDDITEIYIDSPKYGKFTCTINTIDLNKVSMFRWCICKKGKDKFYVVCSGGRYYIHQLILPNGEIDHINGDPLDNRKGNLRIVTHQQNLFNNSKAKGYSLDKRNGKWQAQICINDRHLALGLFEKEEDARKAYLQAKKVYHVVE